VRRRSPHFRNHLILAETTSVPDSDWRAALVEFIRTQARPADKFSHQPRLYRLAAEIAHELPCDDDVLFAAAWLHDLGVFIGHRPEDLEALAKWDNVAYACAEAPRILERLGFPPVKIPAVVAAIRDHLPGAVPSTPEGMVLRDADILEQLGAVGILRTVSKVGRDTRFRAFADALKVLRSNLENLPGQLRLARSRKLARPRVDLLRAFVEAAEAEAGGVEW
jgi:uncharacterized protein